MGTEDRDCNLATTEAEIRNQRRHIRICISTIAQLSIGVGSKAPDSAIILHCDAVRASAYGNRSAKIAHYYRRAAVRVSAISKLTTIVIAPSHHRRGQPALR